MRLRGRTYIRTRTLLLLGMLTSAWVYQDELPVVAKDSVSVHTVERGNMPLVELFGGTITSLHPPRATVVLTDASATPCKTGQKASSQIGPPPAIAGSVFRVDGAACEIDFSKPLPEGTKVGVKVGALIQTGEIPDTIFFARPSDSKGDSEAFAFVLDEGGDTAHRVTVRYGKLSGPMIQILSGLMPGDRVIVTDMAKYSNASRVRLQ